MLPAGFRFGAPVQARPVQPAGHGSFHDSQAADNIPVGIRLAAYLLPNMPTSLPPAGPACHKKVPPVFCFPAALLQTPPITENGGNFVFAIANFK